MAGRLMLDPDQRALLHALCHHRSGPDGSPCMTGSELKSVLAWGDTRLFAVTHTLGSPGALPIKQVITYRSQRMSGSLQECVDQVCLGPDAIQWCNAGEPATL